MYAYAAEDPVSDSDISFVNNPHGAKAAYLIHRTQHNSNLPHDVKMWDLRNLEVS